MMLDSEGTLPEEQKYLLENVQPVITNLIEDVLQAEAMPEDAETFVIDWLRRRAGSSEGQGRSTRMSLRQENEVLKQELSDLETSKAKADDARAEARRSEQFHKLERSLASWQARQDEQLSKMQQSMASLQARQDEQLSKMEARQEFRKMEQSMTAMQAQQDAQLATTRELFASLLQAQEQFFAKMGQPGAAAQDTVPRHEEMHPGKTEEPVKTLQQDEIEIRTEPIETSSVEKLDDEEPEKRGHQEEPVVPAAQALERTLFLTLKDDAAVCDPDSVQVSYDGHIRDDAEVCWISFPGKYAAGWAALTKECHKDSVACVFLCTPKDGLGVHELDPTNEGKCYCHRIYGIRDFRRFGYLLEMKEPFTDERIQRHRDMAAAMNAVFVPPDATEDEKEAAAKQAEAQWEESGCVAAWGCAWYPKWKAHVKKAVEKRQRLKVVFFQGQSGQGKVAFDELSHQAVDLWDGVGCGGSQKCEIATVDLMRKAEGRAWDYDEVDVSRFLKDQFEAGHRVDAKKITERGCEWVRSELIEELPETRDGFSWRVRCEATKERFVASDIRHASMAIEQLMEICGQPYILEALRHCLSDVGSFGISPGRLPSGIPTLQVTMRIPDIQMLHGLRDRVLDGSFERAFNDELSKKAPNYKVQLDKGPFLTMYESSLLALEKLTTHQIEKLSELEGVNSAHLSAPAGAGKTFVAIQYVFDTLRKAPSARILYVAPSEALGLHFLRWLATRIAAHGDCHDRELLTEKLQQVFSRMKLLHAPYTQSSIAKLDGERILHQPEEKKMEEEFDLVVFDECHRYFDAASGVGRHLYDSVSATRRLLLSDESQSSADEHVYPRMKRVRLTEVIRSTRKIVAGAAAFQLGSETGEPVTCMGPEGPPLKTYVFQVHDPSKKTEEYTARIVEAMLYVTQMFRGVCMHRRVAILTPSLYFCQELRPTLQKGLKDHFPHRSFCLESFDDSLTSLPDSLGLSPHSQTTHESLIMDTMDRVDGLEQLIVICVGLDSTIQTSRADLQTRSQLYRGITRAQLLAIVINEHVPGGWLEFLGSVKYREAELSELEADSPRMAQAAKERHQATLARAKAAAAAAHLSRQDEAAEEQKESRLEEVRDAAQDASASPPEASGQTPVEASRPKPKAAAVKTSSVWDTDSNNVPAPTELLFDPLPEAAGKEVYATFDKEHGRRHRWEFDGDAAECPSDGPKLLVSAETASTGILRWCIKSQKGEGNNRAVIIGILPAEKAEDNWFLHENGGYGIKSKDTNTVARVPVAACDIYGKYIEVIADLDTRVAKVAVGETREQMLEATSFDIPFQGDAKLAITGWDTTKVKWLPPIS